MIPANCRRVWRGAVLGVMLAGGLLCGEGLCGNVAYAQTGPTEDDATSADSSAYDVSEGRAARWRQKRQQKSETIEEPTSTFMQRSMSFVSDIGGDVLPHRLILDIPQFEISGFHPVFGGLGGGAGTTAGVLYEPFFWQGENRLAEIEMLGSLQGYYGGGARFGGVAGSYVGYMFGRYRHRPDETFYGIGPESELEPEVAFRLNEGVFGGLLGRTLGSSALLGGHVSYQVNRYASRGDNQHVPSDQFGTKVGGVRTSADYLMLGTFFELDSRDTPYRREFGHRFAPTEPRLRGVSLDASRGFYLAAEATHNVNVHEQGQDFTRFTLDAREFWPIEEGLLHGFSFRQFGSVTRTGGGSVPFYRLQSIGGARSLRGYSSGRFRDRNVLLANAEVRCQIWHWIDMAVFADAGHVFHEFEEVDVGDPRVGYGVGFRVKKNGKTLGRVDLARGDEGWRVHLDLGSLF